MNKQIIIIISFLAFTLSASGQNTSPDQLIPQEKIFVHYNATFLIPGENLHYKVYCLNTSTNNLSDLSKISYVELVSTDYKSVFKEKITLKNGMGDGFFFVPSTIQSGSYKLIAYTQWMRNGDEDLFFQGDVVIVNPFQVNEKIISKDKVSTLSSKNQNTQIKSSITDLELKINKSRFNKRERVVLKTNHINNALFAGNYSISVRKIDQINTPQKSLSLNFDSKYQNNKTDLKNVYLPELRGELLSGTVIDENTKNTLSNQKVGLSIPGKEFIFKVANTNNKGVFYFNIDNEYKSSDAIFQVIGKERDDYEIIIDKQSPIELKGINFYDFKINKHSEDIILEHSIYNQIENSYTSVKVDSIKKIDPIEPFFKSKSVAYILDDYNRFPTLKETIVEIIPEIFVRNRRGTSTLHVRVYDEDIETGLSSLVLVDGIMVQDHNNLVNINAKKIKKIELVDELYLYGSQVFEGIIYMETFEGSFKNTASGNFIQSVELFKPQSEKIFFKQVYDNDNKKDRVPDYRIQLLWDSNIMLKNKENEIIFFTSDVTGDFEISLEGFTNNGQPVSLRKIFSVK